VGERFSRSLDVSTAGLGIYAAVLPTAEISGRRCWYRQSWRRTVISRPSFSLDLGAVIGLQ
jgi:hypothetical protein